MANNKSTAKSDRPPFKRAWFWITIVVSLVLSVVGLVLMFKGIFDAADSEKSTKTPTSGLTTIKEHYDDEEDDDWFSLYEEEEDVPVYKIGEAAQVGDLQITVTSIERNFSTGNRFDTPDEGMEYVKVNLTIVNTAKKKVADYSPFDFELEDGDGDIQNYATSLQSDHLGRGSLAAGGKKTGSLVFEVTAKDTRLTLHYDDYDNGEASFKLY